jgi:hypothetical protein
VKLRLKLLTYTVTIISIYAPVEGKTPETEEFFDELQAVCDKINKSDYLIPAGDFNARVGAQPVDTCIGLEGEQTVNNNGRDLIIKRHFGNMTTDTKLRLHDITSTAVLCYGSEMPNDWKLHK